MTDWITPTEPADAAIFISTTDDGMVEVEARFYYTVAPNGDMEHWRLRVYRNGTPIQDIPFAVDIARERPYLIAKQVWERWLQQREVQP